MKKCEKLNLQVDKEVKKIKIGSLKLAACETKQVEGKVPGNIKFLANPKSNGNPYLKFFGIPNKNNL